MKELHSSGKFAPIPKGAKLKSRQDAASVPVGTVTVQDQNVGDQHGPCCSRCLAAGCPQENGPQIFGFVSAWLEHSFSQGLKLQQNYGGGIGYILIKDALQELEVKASMHYIDQRFESGSSNNLVGSVFGETYNRKFVHRMLLTKQANFVPKLERYERLHRHRDGWPDISYLSPRRLHNRGRHLCLQIGRSFENCEVRDIRYTTLKYAATER